MNKTFFIWGIIIVVLLVGLFSYPKFQSKKPGELDEFASCLGEKGAKFYGAFWCPHCGNQKKLFGRSERLLPYIECSTPDGNSQTLVCKDAGIEGYPTWEFADEVRESGELSLERLAEKTGCELPL